MLSILSFRSNIQAFRELLLLLTRYRQLTVEMARREISDRYFGQFFGVFWAFGHPLVMMAVYVFVFGFVFKVRISSPPGRAVDYSIYLLAGLIPWLAFQESMAKASTVIVTNTNLVKQVVFPLEVLPVKGVLATLSTQVIFLGLLTGYIVARYHSLPLTYFLLPLLISFQTLAMIGVSYILCAIGVYLRDIKDFVQVFSVVGVYLMPTFYLPDFVPRVLRPLLFFNPFSHLIWCYQDTLYYGHLAHPWAWPILGAMSLGAFIFGYRLFRKLKAMFGNVL